MPSPMLKDETGNTYGLLKVLSKAESVNGHAAWNCRCECGNELVAIGRNLRQRLRHCGCEDDLTSKRFGDLTVLSETSDSRLGRYWICECSCGAEKLKSTGELQAGRGIKCNHRSPGHTVGGKPTKTYKSWQAMKERCGNPNHNHYHSYGGRGIRVCERWQSFELFLQDMGVRPVGRTLERIDNNGNYEPGNVRWATNEEQARNTRRTLFVEIDEVTKPLVEWAEDFEICPHTVRNRIYRGVDPVTALTEPVDPTRSIAASTHGRYSSDQVNKRK